MPVISMFYGIIVMMYYFDNKQHQSPHIHVSYQGNEGVVGLPEGDLLEGEFPPKQMKLVQAWIEIHRDELMADWQLAIAGKPIFKVEPLK